MLTKKRFRANYTHLDPDFYILNLLENPGNKPFDELLDNLVWKMPAQSIVRLTRMHGGHHPQSLTQLRESGVFADAVKRVAMVGQSAGDLFA
jgi:hypothetical protein